MIGLLLTGHGHFATGLGSSLKLITGAKENIAFVDFEAEHSTETLKGNLERALDELKDCDGVLVFSDLAGGSPFKTAVEVSVERPQQKITVLAGSNLPMIVEGFTMMEDYTDPEELGTALLESGKDSIVRYEMREHQDNAEEDGI